MHRLLVALALLPSVCWCGKDQGCEELVELLNITFDVQKDEYKDCTFGRVVIFPSVNSIGESAFEDATIGNVTIEYANTTLSLGNSAFKAVNEDDGPLTIIRRCNPRGCSMTGDYDDCYRPYTVGEDAFDDVTVTWLNETCPFMPPHPPPPPQVTPTLPPPSPSPLPPHLPLPPLSPPLPPYGPGERPADGIDANRTDDDGTSTLPLIISLMLIAALLTGVLVLWPKGRAKLVGALGSLRRKASAQQRAVAEVMVAELDERASLRKGEDEPERSETFSKWKGRKPTPRRDEAAEGDEEWWLYFGRDNQQNGPVTAEELSRLYDRGTIHDRSYVWKDGMDGWMELSLAPLEYVPAPFKSATSPTPPKPTSKVLLALKPPPLPSLRDSSAAPRRSSVDVGDRVSAAL